jgi:hypothetical protein
MYPSDVITNARHPVTLAGRDLLFRPLEQWEWGELQAWVKSKLPSPVAVAIRALAEASKDGPVPQPVQDALFRQAQEESRRWPPRAASPDWFRVLGSIEGGDAQFLYAAAKASGCEITLDDARAIERSIARDEFWWVVNLCVFGEQPVPKAGGEGTPPSPTTGDGSTSTSAPSAA